MGTFELLELVTDRQTFLAFVKALAAEADEAQRLCREEPDKHRHDDTLGWAHLDVSNFLYTAIEKFEEFDGNQLITWRAVADCLWLAKIYE